MQQAQINFLQDLHMRIARLESKAMEAPATWRNMTKELIGDTPRPSFYRHPRASEAGPHSTASAKAEESAEAYAGQYAEQYAEPYAEQYPLSDYRAETRYRRKALRDSTSQSTVRGHRNTEAFARNSTQEDDAMDNIHAAAQRARIREHAAEAVNPATQIQQADRVFVAELVRHVLDHIKLKLGVHREVAGVHFETDPVNHNIFLVKHSAQIRAIRKLHARMPLVEMIKRGLRTQLDKRFGEGALTQAQIAYVHELVMRDIE
jgi:hypothetical protein